MITLYLNSSVVYMHQRILCLEHPNRRTCLLGMAGSIPQRLPEREEHCATSHYRGNDDQTNQKHYFLEVATWIQSNTEIVQYVMQKRSLPFNCFESMLNIVYKCIFSRNWKGFCRSASSMKKMNVRNLHYVHVYVTRDKNCLRINRPRVQRGKALQKRNRKTSAPTTQINHVQVLLCNVILFNILLVRTINC